ncbi:MAG TPA: M15 family metallopeptidase [Pseudolabrys sp.]|nr:M15 family metallopeptidase [Pseudolabrys sp.]
MPFTLSRGGANVAAEVQRWQYFLRKQGVDQVGAIDGGFGKNTEAATKTFQSGAGLPATGPVDVNTLQRAAQLGYTIVPDDYYEKRKGAHFPPPPADLSSPDNASRNRVFSCFEFIQRPLSQRPADNPEEIVIQGSCDGSVTDWPSANITTIPVPQLKFAAGFNGTIRCHAKAAPIIKALFAKWEQDDLLHLVMRYEGCFVPRYIRGTKTPPEGHPPKRSDGVSTLSNHSFGAAFDINFDDNQLAAEPAEAGQRGSTRELVASANALGVYWGGHFSRLDGNHFEVARLSDVVA